MTIEYKDSKRIQALSGETYYQEADGNSGASMSNGGTYYAYGTEIRAGHSSITKKADKWTIRFGRNNSPQGVVEAHIYTGTEGATSKTHSQTSTNSITVDALSTSGADYSFTFATPHTISAGDVFAIVWKTDTSTSGSNYIDIKLFNALTDMPNTRNYMVSTANWDGSDDDGHTWSVAPSPYTTYTLTSKLELIAEKTLITNVQDNSILVEKDTGRRYWFDEATNITYEDDLSASTNWAGLSGAFSYDATNDEIDFNADTSGSSAYWNLGSTLSDTAWAMRMKVRLDTFSTTSVNIQNFTIGLSSTNGAYNTTQDSIGMLIRADSYGSNYKSTWGNDANQNGNTSNFTRTPSAETIYLEIIRTSATGFTVNQYSDSGYSTLLESKVVTGVTATALQYVKLTTYSEATTNNMVGAITDVKVYDGATSVKPATWTWDYSATRGVFAGGNGNTVMDYITIDTLGNAIDFGDLTQGRWQSGGISSETRGVITGGATPGDVQVNTMDYVTIATTGNAIDFGDLTTARRGVASVSNLTRGVTSGSTVNVIDYITIATTGNATDFGDLTIARIHLASVSSLTRGVFGGGSSSNVMDYITIATIGNAIDFGDLTVARQNFYGISSFTRGVFGGRYPTGNITMDYITIDTTGNAANFGDLTQARYAPGGVSSYFRGCFGGGNATVDVNTIDYITIDTLGNAIDFGDLTVARPFTAGVQA